MINAQGDHNKIQSKFYGFLCQEKVHIFEKLKSFRSWVAMNYHRTKKLLQIVSNGLWTWDRKIFFHGI